MKLDKRGDTLKKKIYTALCISIVLCVLSWLSDYSKLNELTGINNSGLHFNLLTVASILAGFMFTGLGLLISVSDQDIIKKLRSTSIMDKKNGRIITGLWFNIMSIFLALIFILDLEKLLRVLDFQYKISPYLIDFLAVFELICLIYGLIFFALSVKDINKVLDTIQESKKTIPPEVVERLKKNILDKNEKDSV